MIQWAYFHVFNVEPFVSSALAVSFVSVGVAAFVICREISHVEFAAVKYVWGKKLHIGTLFTARVSASMQGETF
jgi:hypothetical protein